MAVMNPCCMKLQLGVTIVAIVNMGISFVAFLWYLVMMLIGTVAIAAVAERNQERQNAEKGQSVETPLSTESNNADKIATLAVLGGIFILIITVIFIISSLITFVTSLILFIGARKKEISKCRLWFVVTLVFLIIYILFKIFNIGVSLWAWEANRRKNKSMLITVVVKEVALAVFSLAVEGYQLWVVYAFIDEIQREQLNPSFVPESGIVHYVPKPPDEVPPYYPSQTAYTSQPGPQMYPMQQYIPMSSSQMGPPMGSNFQYK